MKLVPKFWKIPKTQYETQFIAQSDNTRVTKPVLVERTKYKLNPNEFFFTDRRTGNKVLMRGKDEIVSADNRSTYQKQEAQKRAEQAYKQYEEDKKQEGGMKNLQGVLTFVSPSTYIGPMFNNNGKSYVDNVISGQGTGDAVGNAIVDILTPFAVGGAKSLVPGIIKYSQNTGRAVNGAKSLVSSIPKYSQNVGRRAVETAMRTTSDPNPLPSISMNFKYMLLGKYGGKKRLYHIGNYILTGKRVGPKGYYNSFAHSIGKGLPQPYRGVSYYEPGYYTDENDIIDAFLYQKTIDPKFGVQKVKPDYGVHTDYVMGRYPNKNIQVYEVQNNSSIPDDQVVPMSIVPDDDDWRDFRTNSNNLLNAAGHLKQIGRYNGEIVRRRQDIWKFNPAEYKQKWLDSQTSPWKRKLLDMGLKYVDDIGTPVITRTKWLYGS